MHVVLSCAMLFLVTDSVIRRSIARLECISGFTCEELATNLVMP